MKAKVKATGKIITVHDNGEKFHPRYWSKNQGYDAKELTFIKESSETDLTTWSTVKLKKVAMGLYDAIYQVECFSTGDLLELQAIQNELSSRGYTFNESKSLSIEKA